MNWIRTIRSSLRRELEVWQIGALPGLAIIGLVVLARMMGTLQYLELATLDYMLRFRPAESTDERILIVGINEADIRQTGAYPIPDAALAKLIQALQQHQPAVVGLDIFRDLAVEPGHADWVKVLQESPNLIGIETALPDASGSTIHPPAALPPEQVGFVDTLLDFDGYIRRNLLSTYDWEGNYRFSLTFRLAEQYLSRRGIPIGNGSRDPEAMRFGTTELTRFTANAGSYVRTDASGNQVLINFRSGHEPFQIVSMSQVLSGAVPTEWIRDRVVLIGVMSLSAKDIVNSRALAGRNPNLIYGTEIQAHALSQILSAVLDGRPLLQVWPTGGEYLWIVFWGLLGISLGRFIRSPFWILLGLGIASLLLVGMGGLLLLEGWWVPVAPSLLVLLVNGAGLTALLFYRHEQNLKARIQERQMVIEQTFTAIHNGPLQTLALMLRQSQEQDLHHPFYEKLQDLNRELRAVCESVQQEALSQETRFRVSQEMTLDLAHPLRELLYAVYSDVMTRELPHFKTLRLQLPTFDQMADQTLTLDQKKGLCRFLEEALCNVGKHADGVTQLKVICQQENGQNLIRVMDNGIGLPNSTESGIAPISPLGGRGTEQAKALARQLGGQFQRWPNTPQGTICELTWPTVKPRFWRSRSNG